MLMMHTITSVVLVLVWFSSATLGTLSCKGNTNKKLELTCKIRANDYKEDRFGLDSYDDETYGESSHEVEKTTEKKCIVKTGIDLETCDSKCCSMKGVNKTYVIVDLQLNWHAAYMHCQSKGWRLATVMNQKENDEITALVKAKYPTNFQKENFWLGATDLNNIGTFKWMTTGQKLEYSDWNPGQPDHRRENCLHLWGEYNLKWNNIECFLLQKTVCEYKTYNQCCDSCNA